MTRENAVLVTGAGGFLGRELCAQLAPSFAVVGVDLPHVDAIEGTDWISVDDPASLAKAVLEVNPAVVVHAAFRNRKPPDWTEERYMDEALSVSRALFGAIAAIRSKLLLVSSSAVYGVGGGKAIIDEATPKQPVSPYGRAKDAAEEMALSHVAHGMQLCTVRLFNLVGPAVQVGTFMSDWVKQAIALQRGETDAIRVRHRLTQRDFVDVRDASRALVMLTKSFRSRALFNVASEKPVDLMQVSEELERLAGRHLPFVEAATEVDPTDVRSQCGSSEKLRAAIGWQAEIPWQQSLADLWHTVAEGVAAHRVRLDSGVHHS